VPWLSDYKARRALAGAERKAKAEKRRADEAARKATANEIAELLLTGSFVHALQEKRQLGAFTESLARFRQSSSRASTPSRVVSVPSSMPPTSIPRFSVLPTSS
jgi:hypothetical protein